MLFKMCYFAQEKYTLLQIIEQVWFLNYQYCADLSFNTFSTKNNENLCLVNVVFENCTLIELQLGTMVDSM